MTRDEVLDLLSRRRDAMARRHMSAIAEIYAEDARLESPFAGNAMGHEAIVQAAEWFIRAFPNAEIEEEPAIVDGHRAAIVAEASGTHVGTFMGIEATGRPFRFPVVFLLAFKDGLIVSERRIYDFTGLLIQIGVLKAKPV